MTQPEPSTASQPPPVSQDTAEEEEATTEDAFLAVFAAAVALWLAAATAAVLGSLGVPNLSLLPEATSYIADVMRRADAALHRVWTGTGLEPAIPQYLRGLPYRLDGLSRSAWRRTTRALADVQAANGDVEAMRAAIRESLDPTRYTADVNRLAATEASIAVNSARQARAQRLADLGARVTKQWRTRRDPQVRLTHREAEGQTRAVDQPFLVGGWPMMHPGDPTAPASEVVNCRCVAAYHVEGGPR